MFITLLIVGMACWLAMFSPAEAALAEQTDASPLFDNLGSLHHPITTTSEQAQRYFDQGLRLVYAFNHEEAIRSFEAAAHLDSQAAMPYWGIALALGPNINSTMEKKHERRAVEMVQKARRLADHTTRGEKAYIEALVVRYVGRKGMKRKGLDEAYAKAMRSVAQQFPEDDDAATLFAEALMDLRPWDFWKPDGRPQPGTDEIVTTLSPCSRETPIIQGPATTTFIRLRRHWSPNGPCPVRNGCRVSCRAPASRSYARTYLHAGWEVPRSGGTESAGGPRRRAILGQSTPNRRVRQWLLHAQSTFSLGVPGDGGT